MSHHKHHHHHHNKEHEQHHQDSLILVFGPTGHIGSKVTKYLVENGDKVRVFIRKESLNKVEDLKKQGAQISIGNIEDSKSVEEALIGVDVVVSNLSNPQDELKLIEILKKHTKTIKLYLPSLHSTNPDNVTKEELAIKELKAKVVQAAKDSGLNYIIIHTTFWLNYIPMFGFDFKNFKAEIASGTQKLSFIHQDDIAALYHLILHDKNLLNKTVTLSHEKITLDELLTLFEKHTGKKFEVKKLLENELKEKMASALNPFNFYALLNSQFKYLTAFTNKLQSDGDNHTLFPDYKSYKSADQVVKDLIEGKEQFGL